VCLSNVKNIALAMQMYFADNNDTFPPAEHRMEAREYFASSPGVGGDGWMADDDGWCPHNDINANPYLRYAVILDEYVKNRDVWHCPSAKMEAGALFINACVPDWLGYLQKWEGSWGRDADLCIKDSCFPPGWGGTVTDSCLQGITAGNWAGYEAWGAQGTQQKSFVQSIGLNGSNTRDMKMTAIQDAANFVVCSDVGAWTEMVSAGLVAYPDYCAVECSNCWCTDSWIEDCIDNLREGCPDAVDCFYQTHGNSTRLRDQTQLSPGTRHLGGINVGFADGHASWFNSARFMDIWAEEAKEKGATAWPYAKGLYAWGPYSWWDCGSGPFSVASGGEPTLR